MKIAEIKDKNRIEVYDRTQFDISSIMHSGQVFRHFKDNGIYTVISASNYARLYESSDNKVIIESNDSRYFFDYFDLATDYNKIKNDLNKYERISDAIREGGGIRILRADFIETVISFIISANNNIKRFTKTLNLIAENFGDKLEGNLYAFPNLSQLQKISLNEFKDFGSGYRAAYLIEAINQLKDIDIKELESLSNDLLIKKLKTVKGVGQKVASCIALFCSNFHRLNIAPVDTWIQKALSILSQSDREALLNHKYAGIAQQYLFYYLQYLHREL